MRIKKLLTEDDAVSPVIGVILMVAITVILAAVIASFVLGLGDTADEVQPTSSFSFDYDDGDESLEITLSDGDSIEAQNFWIRGTFNSTEGADVNSNLADYDSDDVDVNGENVEMSGVGGFSDEPEDGDEVSSGQGVEFTLDGNDESISEYDIDVVWDTGDDSSTLDSSEGPDA